MKLPTILLSPSTLHVGWHKNILHKVFLQTSGEEYKTLNIDFVFRLWSLETGEHKAQGGADVADCYTVVKTYHSRAANQALGSLK